MMAAQVEVNRLANALGFMTVDEERFSELVEAHHRAIEQRAVAEAMWHVLVTKRKARK
jgi:hypothetical protein